MIYSVEDSSGYKISIQSFFLSMLRFFKKLNLLVVSDVTEYEFLSADVHSFTTKVRAPIVQSMLFRRANLKNLNFCWKDFQKT